MPTGVYIRTEEHKKNMSESRKGHSVSTETKEKISNANKGESSGNYGKEPWNKGIKADKDERIKRFVEAGHKVIKEKYDKGYLVWNKDLSGYHIHTEEHKQELREQLEEKNPNWKADNVKYGGLHDWVRKHLGKPKRCDYCGSTEKEMYHWANKSGLYLRELNDWIRLCVSCHKKYDINRKKKSNEDISSFAN